MLSAAGQMATTGYLVVLDVVSVEASAGMPKEEPRRREAQ